MEEKKEEKKIWYRDPMWWLSKAGWPAFVVMLIFNLLKPVLFLGGIQKELFILNDCYNKEISPTIKRIPKIETKINDEIIPTINFLKNELGIKSPSIKEMHSLREELNNKEAKILKLTADLVKAKSLITSTSYIKSELNREANKVSDIRSKIVSFHGGLDAVQGEIMRNPNALTKISQDETLKMMFDSLKTSQNLIWSTDSELKSLSEDIRRISDGLEWRSPSLIPTPKKGLQNNKEQN